MGEGGCDKGNKVILPALPFVRLPLIEVAMLLLSLQMYFRMMDFFFTIALRLQQIQSVCLCRGFMDHLKPYDCITSYLSSRLTHLNSSSDIKVNFETNPTHGSSPKSKLYPPPVFYVHFQTSVQAAGCGKTVSEIDST